jgi:hypothetical protein
VIGGYGIGMPSSSQDSHMPHPQQQQMMMATAGGEAHSMANLQLANLVKCFHIKATHCQGGLFILECHILFFNQEHINILLSILYKNQLIKLARKRSI